MKAIHSRLLRRALWISLAATLPLMQAAAKGTVKDLYKSKCQICHGEDGAPTMAGKSMGARDLRLAEVQNQTDSQLNEIITKGKKKMPSYQNSLTEAQIKDLVGYIRDLAKGAKK